jgi:hypothetical protein
MAVNGMRLLDYSASSPDLNLAENPIGQIKYAIMIRRERRSISKEELKQAIA